MTDTKKTFGLWIRQQRLLHRLTHQQVVARRKGLEQATISRIENDQTQITVVMAVRLCDALDISLQTLIQEVVISDQLLLDSPHKRKRTSVQTTER